MTWNKHGFLIHRFHDRSFASDCLKCAFVLRCVENIKMVATGVGDKFYMQFEIPAFEEDV
jgi:hypothetical protein